MQQGHVPPPPPKKGMSTTTIGLLGVLLVCGVMGIVAIRGAKTSTGATHFPDEVTKPGVEVPASPPKAATVLDGIHRQVADDAIAQYEIAKRQGDPIQICVQAGMVAAAWLQAKDEAQYREWKDVEARDCAAAGMPK